MSKRGYDSLVESVKSNCNDYEGCFNPNGCDKEKACSSRYCDKFKWIIDRVKEYGEHTNLDWMEILDAFEERRSYWYMNYYEEGDFPSVDSGKIRFFETVEDLVASTENKGFRCPACNGISTNPYECNSGQEMSSGKTCDWKVYGLFGGLGKDIVVFCKDKKITNTIFMPVAWEDNNGSKNN